MNYADPKLSLIIITHDNGEYFIRALNSAVNQDATFPFEIIVVMDDCNDSTKEVVVSEKSKHPYINYFDVSFHCPLKNRLYGLEQAKGKYVIFLDGDDYLAPNMFSRMVSIMESEKADMVIDLPGGKNYSVSIYDLSGREVHRSSLQAQGTIVYSINAARMASGQYTVVFTNGSERVARKLIVK